MCGSSPFFEVQPPGRWAVTPKRRLRARPAYSHLRAASTPASSSSPARPNYHTTTQKPKTNPTEDGLVNDNEGSFSPPPQSRV
ncbi:hypothetical protein GHT06_014472 [Daphnia sinensis]|uniref:Uncharacterized protein n=1 Tax=Daphnia sinensis TaxID=1820382 RepID=A0AAD5LDX6_9CRUS|nr:hypothetical protein GHT06_014472 [Daphnia sinensis]